MNCDRIFDEIDKLNDEYVGFWADICNIESPTAYKKGVDEVGAYIIAKAKAHGWTVEIDRQEVAGDAVCITMNPDAKKSPVCLSAHMDTVHPVGTFGSPAVKIRDGKIYGPGVTDCKGGIASAFLAMHALESCGYTERPVKLILQSDEELSSLPSNKGTVDFMARCAKGCAAFLNGEPSSESYTELTVERKGIIRFILDITGIAAHSSACYNGASAVLEAAYKVIELERFADKDGLTSNCGIINGGQTANSVPDKCEITVDFRYKTQEQREEAVNAVKTAAENTHVKGTSCTWRIKSERCAMPLTERNIELVEKIDKIYRENGFESVVGKANNGGSDAADMTSRGIAAVDSIGTSGGRIHSTEEYGNLESLAESAKRQAAIIVNID